jgi:hypothetical protein
MGHAIFNDDGNRGTWVSRRPGYGSVADIAVLSADRTALTWIG